VLASFAALRTPTLNGNGGGDSFLDGLSATKGVVVAAADPPSFDPTEPAPEPLASEETGAATELEEILITSPFLELGIPGIAMRGICAADG